MKNKVQAMKDRMEIRKAEKKGAASIETIIVSGLLIALAVGIIIGFNRNVQENATKSNVAISGAVTSMDNEIDDAQKIQR